MNSMLYFKDILLLLFFIMLSGALQGQLSDLRYFEIGFRDKPDSVNVYAATSEAAVLAVIDQQLQMPVTQRNLHISGQIARGTDHNNYRYNWHFIPGEWTLTAGANKSESADPRAVDENLFQYLTNGKTYTPANSYVKREVTAAQEKQIAGKESLDIYPNPASQKLFVRLADFPHAVQHVVLYDVNGRPIEVVEPSSNWSGTLQFEVGSLSGGHYLLSVRTDRGIWSEKVLVR